MNLLKRFAQISSIALASAMIASCASDSSSSGSSSEAETTENPTAQQKKAEAKPSYAYAKTAFDASSDADSMSMKECQGRAGVEIKMGIDKNADGKLEGDEVEKTEYVCDGAKGAAGAAGATGDYTKVHTVSFSGTPTSAEIALLVKDNTTADPAVTYAGTSAAYCKTVGGVQVNFYTESGDTAGFDAKDTVLKTTYVCNGADGSNGQAGQAGNNAPAQLAYQAKFTNDLATNSGVSDATKDIYHIGNINVIQKDKAGQVAGYDRVLFNGDFDGTQSGADAIGVLNDGKASELENLDRLKAVDSVHKTKVGGKIYLVATDGSDVKRVFYFNTTTEQAELVKDIAVADNVWVADNGIFVVGNAAGAVYSVKDDAATTATKLASGTGNAGVDLDAGLTLTKLDFSDSDYQGAAKVSGDFLYWPLDNDNATTPGLSDVTHVLVMKLGHAFTTNAPAADNDRKNRRVLTTAALGAIYPYSNTSEKGVFIAAAGGIYSTKNEDVAGKDQTDTTANLLRLSVANGKDAGFSGGNVTAADFTTAALTKAAQVSGDVLYYPADTAGNTQSLAAVGTIFVLKAGEAFGTNAPTANADARLLTIANLGRILPYDSGSEKGAFILAAAGIYSTKNADTTTGPASALLRLSVTDGKDAGFSGGNVTAADFTTAALTKAAQVSGDVLYYPADTGGNAQTLAAVDNIFILKAGSAFGTGTPTANANARLFSISNEKLGRILPYDSGSEKGAFIVNADGIYSTKNADTTTGNPVANLLVSLSTGSKDAGKVLKAGDFGKLLADAAVVVKDYLYHPVNEDADTDTKASANKVLAVKAGSAFGSSDSGADGAVLSITDNGEISPATDGIFTINTTTNKMYFASTKTSTEVTGVIAGLSNGDIKSSTQTSGGLTNYGFAGQTIAVGHATVGSVKVARDLNPQHTTIVDKQAVHVGGKLYFGSGDYLWESDGTKAGTKILGKHTVTSITTDGTDVYFATGTDVYKLAVSNGTIAPVKGSNQGSITKLTAVGTKIFAQKSSLISYLKADGTFTAPGTAVGTPGIPASIHAIGKYAVVVGGAKLTAVANDALATEVEIKDNKGNVNAGDDVSIDPQFPAVAGDVLFISQDAGSADTLFVTQGATDNTFQVKDDDGAVKASAAFKAAKVGNSYYVLIDNKLYKVDASDGSAEVVDYGADSGSNLAVVSTGSGDSAADYLFVITKFKVFVKKEGAKEVFKETDLKRYGFTKQTNDYITHPTVVGNKLYFLANSASGNYFSNHGIEWFYTEQN